MPLNGNSFPPGMPKLHILMEIGCIECGMGSEVVGVFDSRAVAERAAAECHDKFHWRYGGENSFEVFDIDTDVGLNRVSL